MKKNRKGSDTRRSGKPAASAALLDLPVAKNDEVVIDIIGMNHDGEGSAVPTAILCSFRAPCRARRPG